MDPNRAYESVRTILDDMQDGVSGDAHSDHPFNSKESDQDAFGADFSTETLDPVSDVDAYILDDQDMDDMAAENFVDDVENSSKQDEVEGMSSANAFNDNVIDAAQAFRPAHANFGEALKTQYSTSDPS